MIVYFSWDLNRKPNSYFSIQNTNDGSQEPSLKLTLIAVIGDSADWQGRLQRLSTFNPQEHAQPAHPWSGYSEDPTVSMPLSFMYCEDEGKDRTFDLVLPANTIYCLCFCVLRFPSQAERIGRHSKAMKAWLWSVIHVWQVLRGPRQHSAAFGIMTGPQDCDANEAPEAVCIFQHSKHHIPESKESSWAHCSLVVHIVKLIPLLILFYSHLTIGIWKSTWPLSTIAAIFLQTDANV